MQKVIFKDQLRRQVSVAFPPKRIISLVPSQTELLFELGLDEEIVGVTKFCIHPAEGHKAKTKVGGTKKLNLELIRSLRPDLIIGNKEENEKDQIELLMQEFPVWMSDISNLEDALEMIRGLGSITGRADRAREIAERINNGFMELAMQNKGSRERIAYLIWKDPYMAAGRDTFINDVIERAGWINAIELSRYPEMSPEGLKVAAPDRIFLSSEPYPFKEKHIAEFLEMCPDAEVMVVDGEMFSWYGSRLLSTSHYLQTLSAGRG